MKIIARIQAKRHNQKHLRVAEVTDSFFLQDLDGRWHTSLASEGDSYYWSPLMGDAEALGYYEMRGFLLVHSGVKIYTPAEFSSMLKSAILQSVFTPLDNK